MNLDKALDILDGGKLKIYDTPHGSKLSITTRTGDDWHFTTEEREAAQDVMGDYEDVAVRAYEADDEDELACILSKADVNEPWRVIGRIENIPVSVNKALKLATQDD